VRVAGPENSFLQPQCLLAFGVRGGPFFVSIPAHRHGAEGDAAGVVRDDSGSSTAVNSIQGTVKGKPVIARLLRGRGGGGHSCHAVGANTALEFAEWSCAWLPAPARLHGRGGGTEGEKRALAYFHEWAPEPELPRRDRGQGIVTGDGPVLFRPRDAAATT